MEHFDINRICEEVFRGVFQELYGWDQLKNLNQEEKQNFPGIDLADAGARIAIQVTSDKTLSKITDSIKTIIRHGLHRDYDKVVFYILTRKQGSYSTASIDQACQGKLTFDPSSDILDFRDLASKAAAANPRSLQNVVDIMRAHMQGCDVGLAEQDFDPPETPPETLSGNLLELYFPQSLYIAELLPEVLAGQRVHNQRSHLRAYVRRLERSVPSDFVVNEGRIITFHDLSEGNNPFSFLIDEGTVEPLEPSDYYSISEDHDRVFKSLLRFCLQQKLYRHRVLWKHEEGIFIFLPRRDTSNTREETWHGARAVIQRNVFKRTFNRNSPNKVLSTRHFAFAVSFQVIAGAWYMSITPDWFFSYDSKEDKYLQSIYGGELISGRKRLENNRSVLSHFRFLCDWIIRVDSEDMFTRSESVAPQITFGNALELGGGRHLDESLWGPLEPKEDKGYQQGAIDFV